jgi:hypothetical protein
MIAHPADDLEGFSAPPGLPGTRPFPFPDDLLGTRAMMAPVAFAPVWELAESAARRITGPAAA